MRFSIAWRDCSVTDPRERLRRYLEQRRELGEHELVLDQLSVEDALRIVAGTRRGRGAEDPARPSADIRHAPPPMPEPTVEEPVPNDWRETLRAVGAGPASTVAKGERSTGSPSRVPEGIPASTPEVGGQLAPPGIVVGTTSRELFGAGGPSLDSLDSVAKAIATCTRCPLYATAKNPVPGEGNPNAELMFVGEAPGATEDETGRPFIGAAGQLLTKILEAINLPREKVYICNVLKHRPPGNRNPRPEEVSACSPYLIRQIELIRPKVILALGSFAAQALLQSKLSLSKLRGQIHEYHGVPV